MLKLDRIIWALRNHLKRDAKRCHAARDPTVVAKRADL